MIPIDPAPTPDRAAELGALRAALVEAARTAGVAAATVADLRGGRLRPSQVKAVARQIQRHTEALAIAASWQ